MKTCGLDVHKDTIFCAIYDGKDYTKVLEKGNRINDFFHPCDFDFQ